MKRFILSLIALFFLQAPLFAGTHFAREYQIKAGYLYQFGKFIQWPNAENEPSFTIGIIGKNPFGKHFNQIKKKHVNGKPIILKKFASVSDLESCDILFIGFNDSTKVKEVLEAIKDSPTITVSEYDHFNDLGGIIELININKRVRFKINVLAAEEKNLDINSQLIQLTI